MAQILRNQIWSIEPGSRILEARGRVFVRLNDAVAPFEAQEAGFVPICDLNGNVMMVPGSVVMPYVSLDPIDEVTDVDGYDVILRGWQACVN